MERLTPFYNDPLREGWGLMLYLADERRGTYARLLPGEAPFTPFRATHALAHSRFLSGADGLRFETTLYLSLIHIYGLARLSGRFRARRSERELGSGAERDERSLARHMRSLAVQLRVNGRARLSCPASLAAHTQTLAREAGELLRESANAAATLQRLHQDCLLYTSRCV